MATEIAFAQSYLETVRPGGKLSSELASVRLDKIESGSDEAFLRCAVYCTRRLSDIETAILELGGVRINAWAWIPPVAGRHPYGFHVARVYERGWRVLEADACVVRVTSIEDVAWPENDVTAEHVGLRRVHAGGTLPGRTGKGVKVAVLDSGFDLDHPDLPTPIEAWDVTDGESIEEWGEDVRNVVTPHGTHVAGIVAGNGSLSNGQYRGAAPDVSLYLYKVGRDSDGASPIEGVLFAILRAIEVGCRVINYSYGQISRFVDGTGPIAQAFDAAFAEGVVCVSSAGNEGTGARHAEFRVPRSSETGDARYRFQVAQSGEEREIEFYLVWSDGPELDDVELRVTGLQPSEELVLDAFDANERGTRSKIYTARFPHDHRIFDRRSLRFSVSNHSKDHDVVAQLYPRNRAAFFTGGSSSKATVTSPALADTAIAVGNWVLRESWVDFRGVEHSGDRVGIHPTSSQGPRIDGLIKPEIVAPGSGIIAPKDGDYQPSDLEPFCIDNDGIGLDGSGPADYFLASGTSQSGPVVAGIAALLFEEKPEADPREVRNAIILSGSRVDSPDGVRGFGLVDAERALELLREGVPIECELGRRSSRDCDRNGVPDECELAEGFATDSNDNGFLDVCDQPFHRGDANGDGLLDVSDSVTIFGFLFLGAAELDCIEAADGNSDGGLDVTDGIDVLNFLFRGGATPPFPGPPGEPCGSNADEVGFLGCARYVPCEE